MADIKAIPTRYKGYHFRSRLEARWAVFFDEIGLQWEYEAQGYETPHGKYLPDFELLFMGLIKIFFEVKPSQIRIPRHDLERMASFSNLLNETGSRYAFVIVKGDPYTSDAMFCGRFSDQCEQGILEGSIAAWLGLVAGASEETVMRAAAASRSARFEHGEQGAT